MSKTTAYLYGAAWVVLVTAFAFMTLCTYWLVAPYRGLYDVAQPFPVVQTEFYQNELAAYTVSYCVDEMLPLPITIHRELVMLGPVMGVSFTIAPPSVYVIQQRCETRTMAFGIPAYVPTGSYHLQWVAALQVNPLRQVKQSFVTETFSVKEAR